MPVMLEKLYDALKAANVPDDKARAAAVEVAEFKDAIGEIKSCDDSMRWVFAARLSTGWRSCAGESRYSVPETASGFDQG